MPQARLDLVSDNSSLKNSISESKTELKQAQEEAKRTGQTIDNAFKKASTSTSTFGKELGRVTRESNKQVGIINRLEFQIRELEKSRKRANNINDVRAYNKVLATQRKRLADLQREQAGVTKRQGLLGRAFGNFSGQLKGLLKGGLIFGGIAAAVRGIQKAIVSVVRSQAEFNAKLGELSAITGAVGQDLQFYRQAALDVARSNKLGTVSAVEFLEALKLVGSAKPELLSTKEALVETTEAAILLSQASGDDLASSTDSLTKVMNQFNKEAEESTDIVNVLAAGSKFGAGDINFLSDAIVNVGTVAENANISLEQTTGLLEVLAEKGLDARRSSISLRNIILKLQADQDNYTNGVFDINKALTNLNKIQNDSVTLTKRFGTENVVVATILAKNIDRYQQLTAAVTGTNVATEQAAVRTDNLADNWEKLTNRVQAFFIGNSALARGLNNLVKSFLNLTGSMEDTRSANQKLVDTTRQQLEGLTVLQRVVLDNETTERARAAAIREINSEYGDYLPNLIDEKASLDEVTKATNAAIQAMKVRILLASREDEITKAIKRQSDALLENTGIELQRAREAAAAIGGQVVIDGDTIDVPKFDTRGLSTQQLELEQTLNNSVDAFRDATLESNEEIINSTDSTLNSIEELYKNAFKSIGLDIDDFLDKQGDKNEDSTVTSTEAQEKKRAAIIKKARQDLAKDLQKLEQDAQKQRLNLLGGRSEIDAIRDNELKKLEALKERILDEKQAAGQARQLSLEEQAQFNILEIAIRESHLEAVFDLQRQNELLLLKTQDDSLEKRLALLDVKLEDERNKLSEAGLLTEELQTQLDRQREEKRLAITKEYSLEQIDAEEERAQLLISQIQLSGVTAEEAERIKEQKRLETLIEFAQKRIDILKAQGESEDSIAIQRLKALIADTQAELNIMNQERFDLKEILGLTDAELAAVGSALNQLGQSFSQITSQQISDNEALIASIRDRSDEVKRQLEEELEAQREGYANNVDAKRQELDQLGEARAEALEEKDRLQQRERILNALSQASNLATAVTSLLADGAKAGVVGLVAAAGLVPLIFSLFSNARTQADDVTRLAKGGSGIGEGVFKGPSHAGGGVDMFSQVEAEGGEMWQVFSKADTRKYGSDIREFGDMIRSNRLNSGFMKSLMDQKANNMVFINDNSDVVHELRENNKLLKNFEQVSSDGSATITRKGNRVRIIKHG